MLELTILSGKGGTGKTSLTAAFASLADSVVLCDNDVDASNLHLILQPEILESHDFASGALVEIDSSKCSSCGICRDLCRFDAIHTNPDGTYFIDPYTCEACLLCEKVCPDNAVFSRENMKNKWYVSETRMGKLVHARMAAGEENSGKLVAKIRSRAREIARETGAAYLINDGPPGIGCPVISSLSGTQKVLLVTEPSLSGWHDAQRLIQLVRSFDIPIAAVINKADLSVEISRDIRGRLKKEQVPLLAEIPYDTQMIHAVLQAKSILEYAPGAGLSALLKNLWDEFVND